MNVELQLLTTLGSDWLVEFDSPGGYTMNSGDHIEPNHDNHRSVGLEFRTPKDQNKGNRNAEAGAL